MTDMSVALGTDASGSAIQLGKALNDPIKGVAALQKVGVSFTESQKEQIKTLVETGDTLGAQKIILGNSTRSSVARLRLPRPRWASSSSGSATWPRRSAAT
jgi:phage-related minor tail protein